MSMMLWWAFGSLAAWGADLVWIDGEIGSEDRIAVSAAVGANLTLRSPLAFRAAATDLQEADAATWAALDVALREVRPFETRLDGELVIMEELEEVLGRLTIVPDAAARETLFGALAYQGFAVDRFFMDELANDERAEGYRVVLADGDVAPRPWIDAMAIAPDREVTPYEIAEASQRKRYNTLRKKASEILPGRIVVDGPLPAGARILVNGEVVDPGPTRRIRVAAGRHHVHVRVGDYVLARWAERVEPNGTLRVEVPLDDLTWQGWVDSLKDDPSTPPPGELAPSIEAWGGEVLVGWTGARGAPRVVRVTPSTTTEVSLSRRRPLGAGPGRSVGDGGGLSLQIGAGVGAGWFSSGDFYLQDPDNVPRTRASVNAGALSVVADVGLQFGRFRGSIIADVGVPLGEPHVAFTGEGSMRVRPDLSVGLGVKWAQVTAGFLFPYHPTVGARATVPVYRGIEILGSFRAGLPGTWERSDGSSWTSQPVWHGWLGLGYRFGVRVGG